MTDGAYVRDSVELLSTDRFAWSKRVMGFVPKTIFYKEETANSATKMQVFFFQDFGVPNPREIFWSIDEYTSLEATIADSLYNSQYERIIPVGFHRPVEVVARKSSWVPIWPPMLRLVVNEPEWRSVDFEEDRLKRKAVEEREAFDHLISRTCSLCGKDLDLAYTYLGDDKLFVHGVKYNDTRPCLAEALHKKRGTMTIYLPEPEEDVA